MRKHVVIVVLLVVAILMIYKFNTPYISPNVDARNIATADGASGEVTLHLDENLPLETSDVALAEVTQKKIATLKEILSSKNDNDPRIDTELKNLSNQDKDALVSLYQDLKPESLNDKGTIVFLIGRELTRPEDAEFLKAVLSEESCLSLENCGVTNSQSDPHMDSVNEVSLNYPQVVALNRVKTFLQTQDIDSVNPTILSHLADATKIGQSSKSGLVSSRSKEISNLLTKMKK